MASLGEETVSSQKQLQQRVVALEGEVKMLKGQIAGIKDGGGPSKSK